MRQILPYSIWLSHSIGADDFRAIFDRDIKAIVQLAVDDPPLQPPRELIFCRFPLVDGSGNEVKLLYLAATTLANLIEKGVPTLVCCSGGISRSPALTAAALSMVYQEPAGECLKKVAEHHPTDVTPGLWLDVTRLLENERTTSY